MKTNFPSLSRSAKVKCCQRSGEAEGKQREAARPAGADPGGAGDPPEQGEL